MKKVVSIAVLVLLALGYTFFGGSLGEMFTDIDSLTGSFVAHVPNSFIQEEGDVQVYFCPHQDCETALVNFIDSAQESIHCALFDVGLESVQAKLLEKSQEIDVKVVTDNDYLHKFDHDFVKVDKWGLQHNKFCIIDNKKIATGSMNPTNNGAHKNNNNLLFINSETLASNYEAEFQEMWEGTFKKGDDVLNPSIKLGNVQIQNYFCPDDDCAHHIREELKKAQKSIHFMTFAFTHEGIADVLLLKRMDGLQVRGVMEARQISEHSQFERLKYNEIDVVKDANKQSMHHKVFIIDEQCVITGSMNPSKGGDTRNDENVLIMCDEEIASKYVEEFERVYSSTSI